MSYKGIFRAQENKEPIRNFEAEIDKINKELQPQVRIRVPYKNKNVYKFAFKQRAQNIFVDYISSWQLVPGEPWSMNNSQKLVLNIESCFDENSPPLQSWSGRTILVKTK